MCAVRESLRFRLKICNVNSPALEQGLVTNRAPFQGSAPRSSHWYCSEMGCQDHLLTFKEPNRRVIGSAPPSRALGNRVQHRLDIRRPAGDDAQYLARGSLLLQRLLEFVE